MGEKLLFDAVLENEAEFVGVLLEETANVFELNEKKQSTFLVAADFESFSAAKY